MKRNILSIILLICAVFVSYGQNAEPIDLILLINTSSEMSSSYENVNNYITGAFLSEFLRVGDTFHLIAYSENARLDAARRISSRGDVETIVGRMFLQYPVESGNNLSAAMTFTEQYAASLPPRPKKIVLVSTGSQEINNLVGAAKQRLSGRNITLDFVQVTPGQPLTNLPSSGRTAPAARTAATPPASAQTQTGQPQTGQTQAGQAQTGQPQTGQAQTGQPQTGQAQTGQTQTGQPQTGQMQQGSVSEQDIVDLFGEQPPYISETDEPLDLDLDFISDAEPDESLIDEASPEQLSREFEGTLYTPASGDSFQDSSSGIDWAGSMPMIIGGIIVLLLIIGLIIFFSTRKLGSSPNRVMREASSSRPDPRNSPGIKDAPFVDHSKDLAKYAAVQPRQRTTPYTDRHIKTETGKPPVISPSGPLLLNLYVEDQNAAIGKRNIHSLKSGYSLSVGGGKSDYLIFLVPLPQNIGEIRRSGSSCSFIPRKPKYFPDLGSNELRDCINKTIRIISDKNYELRFRFEMYEDPLDALNRVLMSIKVPG